jgi:hypothetical protein
MQEVTIGISLLWSKIQLQLRPQMTVVPDANIQNEKGKWKTLRSSGE